MSVQSSPSDWIHIPNTSASWPWSRKINPHYDLCNAESSAWIKSFSALDKSVQEAINKCIPGLLAALSYPSLDKEGCRIACDLMNLFFVIDECTDKAAADIVQNQAKIILDAIHNPHIPRPISEWVGGEIARQFWSNAIRKMTPTVQCHFLNTFQTYLDGVVEEAKDRTGHHLRTSHNYFEVRRKSIATKPSFTLNEMGRDFPDYIMRHSVIENLIELSTDMIILENDLLSYNREQARGDDTHNLITVVMHEFNMDVQTAIDWVGNYHNRLVHQFLDEWNNIPIVILGLPEQIRGDVEAYCEGLAMWVRSNNCWSFESERYFGKRGREIQNTLRIQLLPRESM